MELILDKMWGSSGKVQKCKHCQSVCFERITHKRLIKYSEGWGVLPPFQEAEHSMGGAYLKSSNGYGYYH